ncbi:malate transporter [Enterobacter sp. CGMCC 5087]|nr:malate transporter [Enterobacter sp. CGMCC 5087]
MRLSLTVEADTINVLALNMGRIAVDIDGIELADLINVVSDNGYSLRVADEPGKLIVEDPLPPVARLTGIQCSTAHITEADNTLLFALSHQYEDFGESEWIHFSGSGYLLRLSLHIN